MTAEEQFESIVKALRSDSRINTSKMFGSSGLKVGGKVFAMLFKGKLVVKLSREQVATLVASGDGEHFDPGHGRKMKEWVVVGPRTGGQWLRLVREAKDFVTSGPGGTGRRSRSK